jgi:hypothetical protein
VRCIHRGLENDHRIYYPASYQPTTTMDSWSSSSSSSAAAAGESYPERDFKTSEAAIRKAVAGYQSFAPPRSVSRFTQDGRLLPFVKNMTSTFTSESGAAWDERVARRTTPSMLDEHVSDEVTRKVVEASKVRRSKVEASSRAGGNKRKHETELAEADAEEDLKLDDEDVDPEERRIIKASRLVYSPGIGLASLSRELLDKITPVRKSKVEAAGFQNGQWLQPQGQYAQQGAESYSVGQDTALINEIAPFMGLPTKHVPIRESDAHSYESHELPDAFVGQRDYLQQIIVNGVLESDRWHLTEALEPKEKQDLKEIVLHQTIYDNRLLGRVPYLGIPDLVTNRQATRRAGVVKFGLGHELEGHFYRTEVGRQMWAHQQMQIMYATQETFCLGVITELLTCRSPATNEEDETNTQVQSRADYETRYLRPQFNQWDSIRKGTQGLRTTAENAKKLLRMQNTTFADENLLFIIPQGASAVQALDPDRNNSSVTGVSKPNYDPITMTPTVFGVGTTRESRSFRMGRGKPDYDPMYQDVAIGSYFQSLESTVHSESTEEKDLQKFRTEHMNLSRYRAQDDDEFVHKFSTMFEASQLYGEEQKLTSVGRYFFAHRKFASAAERLEHERRVRTLTDNQEAKGGDATIRSDIYALHRADTSDQQAKARYFSPDDADDDVPQNRKKIQDDLAEAAEVEGHHSAIGIKNAWQWYEFAGRTAQIEKLVGERMKENKMNGAFALAARSLTARSDHSNLFPVLPEQPELKWWLSNISLETSAWWKFCHTYHIPTYIIYRVFVPVIVWSAGTSILMVKNSGNTYVGFARYSVARNAKTDLYLAAFSIHARALADPTKVVRVRNSFIKSYEYGDNGIFYRHGDRGKLAREGLKPSLDETSKTCFSIALPPGFKQQSSVCDMYGTYPANACIETSYHYPTAPTYRKYWGFKQLLHRGANSGDFGTNSDDASTGRRNRNGATNTVCAQGMQRTWKLDANGGGWTQVTVDCGHKEEHWGPLSRRDMERSGTRMIRITPKS